MTDTLQIKRPDHEPVTVKLCGNDYVFRAPENKRQHIKLHGLTALAQSRMASNMAGALSVKTALEVAKSDTPETTARQVLDQLDNADKLRTLGCMEIAIDEVFDAVCYALRLAPQERDWLDDHFDMGELFVAFNTIAGLVNRPFGGIKNAMKPKPQTPTGLTDSERHTP